MPKTNGGTADTVFRFLIFRKNRFGGFAKIIAAKLYFVNIILRRRGDNRSAGLGGPRVSIEKLK
jgi:hypothetical protein